MSEMLDRVIATTKQSGSSSEIAVRLFDEVQHLADTDLPAIVALAQGSQYKAFADLLVGYLGGARSRSRKKMDARSASLGSSRCRGRNLGDVVPGESP